MLYLLVLIGNLNSRTFLYCFSIRGKNKFGAKKEKGETIKNKFTPFDQKVSDKVVSICKKNPLTEVQTSLDQIHADVQQLIASVMDQQTETLSLLGKYKDQAAIANIANNADWICFVICFSATIVMIMRTHICMVMNYPSAMQ